MCGFRFWHFSGSGDHICLQFYLRHGLVLTKIHRVISFTQRAFMLPFIKYCNEGRKNAESDFESSLYKLLANAFYGKTVENVRNRVNVRLISDPRKFVKAVGKASYKRSQIINTDLALVENVKGKILLSKPIAVGCTILEIAKLVMYEFYYDCLLPKFGDRLHLCFYRHRQFHLPRRVRRSRRGSSLHLRPVRHVEFRPRPPAVFRSEPTHAWKIQIRDGRRSADRILWFAFEKMYSLATLDGSRSFLKAKGVPRTYVKKTRPPRTVSPRSETLDDYDVQVPSLSFDEPPCEVTTRELAKICPSCVDDKRHLLEDAVHSLAYGHRDISPP